MSHINCSSCGVSFELGIPYSSGSICPDCNYVVHCSGCFRDFPVHQLKDDDGVLFCSDCLNLAAAPVPDSALASSGVAAPVSIQIDPAVYSEFVYMCELAEKHGSFSGYLKPDRLIAYVLRSIADGSRRPSSWERDLLAPLGLVVDCDEHYEYRSSYGRPASQSEEQSK